MVKHLLSQTVTLYDDKSVNEFGEESWTTGNSSRGRFQLDNILVMSPDGKEVLSDAVCYLPKDASVSLNGRIDYGGLRYRIIGLEESVGELGNIQLIKTVLQKLA